MSTVVGSVQKYGLSIGLFNHLKDDVSKKNAITLIVDNNIIQKTLETQCNLKQHQ